MQGLSATIVSHRLSQIGFTSRKSKNKRRVFVATIRNIFLFITCYAYSGGP